MVLGNLIGGFVVILIGTSLMPVVGDQVFAARFAANGTDTSSTNVSGTASTIVGLVTLFFALGVMATGIALATNGLKQAGLM